jgi:hypothetical protein
MTFKNYTKKQLVDFGTELGLSLNINDKKEKLINQIEEAEGHLEAVPGEGFVWVKSDEKNDTSVENDPTISKLKRETERLKNSLAFEQEIRRKAESKKEKMKSEIKTWLFIGGGMTLLALAYISQDKWLCSGYDCIAI